MTPGQRKPQNAVGLVRLSDLRDPDLDDEGRGKGNVDQTQRIGVRAQQLGWQVTRIIVENDLVSTDGKVRGVSAFKRRKTRLPNGRVEMRTFRPGFRQVLDLLASGEHDGLIALDIDRVLRDPRDLEDLIDVVEEHHIPVESVTGSLRLANDAEVTMARVMVAMGNKSSRDTRRRVAAARERQARAGEFGGGHRPFGFDEDGVTLRPAEAAVIADCSVRVVQGASLRSVAAELRRQGVVTSTGRPFAPDKLRDVLLRPRNAGRLVYQGEEIGDAPWKPIVALDTFRAVQRELQDPGRRTNPGPATRWLGSNIFQCGLCSDRNPAAPAGMFVRYAGDPTYVCKRMAHLRRSVKYVDKLVEGTILARLAQPDAADLLTPVKPEVDVAALRTEAKAIRTSLKELAADRALGLIDRDQLIAGTERGKARLDEIDTLLRTAAVDSPMQPLINAEDIRNAWHRLGLSHQRLVVQTLVTVRILPTGRGSRIFDPSRIEIIWKDQQTAPDTISFPRTTPGQTPR
jgi:DNA invertase Pin-like site-specific DNA recombinase